MALADWFDPVFIREITAGESDRGPGNATIPRVAAAVAPGGLEPSTGHALFASAIGPIILLSTRHADAIPA